MIPIETVVRVSQYAMNLVMAGKAYFGSGGVRLIENDRFVELYKLLPSYQTQQPGIMPINPFIPTLPAPATIAPVFNCLAVDSFCSAHASASAPVSSVNAR